MNHTLVASALPRRRSLISLLYPILIFVFSAYLLFFAPKALDAVRTGLEICATRIIPSLFPFMVLSNLFVGCGLAERLGRRFSSVFSRFFGIDGNGAAALLIGLFSGFPLGASCAVDLCDKGLLTRRQTETLLAFCSNTGPAFLIGSVGTALWGDARIGWILYAAQAIAALLCGLFAGIGGRRAVSDDGYTELIFDDPPASPTLHAFTDAITAAVPAVLQVCGFVILFRIFSTMAVTLFSQCVTTPYLSAAVASLLEISSGAASIAETAVQTGMRRSLAVGLTGAAVGWSGLAVHLQVASFTSRCGLSLRRYFAGKIWSAFACFALSLLFAKIFLI